HNHPSCSSPWSPTGRLCRSSGIRPPTTSKSAGTSCTAGKRQPPRSWRMSWRTQAMSRRLMARTGSLAPSRCAGERLTTRSRA
ncbi:unnamed protein product, partial [Lampetra fluviatilis]